MAGRGPRPTRSWAARQLADRLGMHRAAVGEYLAARPGHVTGTPRTHPREPPAQRGHVTGTPRPPPGAPRPRKARSRDRHTTHPPPGAPGPAQPAGPAQIAQRPHVAGSPRRLLKAPHPASRPLGSLRHRRILRGLAASAHEAGQHVPVAVGTRRGSRAVARLRATRADGRDPRAGRTRAGRTWAGQRGPRSGRLAIPRFAAPAFLASPGFAARPGRAVVLGLIAVRGFAATADLDLAAFLGLACTVPGFGQHGLGSGCARWT